MYTYIQKCIYKCIYTHIHIYKCLYTCTHIQMFIYMYTYTNIYIHVYIYRDLYIHVYIDIFLSQSYTYMVNLVWFNLKRFHLHLVTNQNKKTGTFHIYCPVLSLLQTSQWKLHPYQSISTLPRQEGMHTLTTSLDFYFKI